MVFSDSDDMDVETGPAPACPSKAQKASNTLPDSESHSSRNVSSHSTTSKETTGSESQGGKRKPSKSLPNLPKRTATSSSAERKECDFTSDVWDYFHRDIVKGKEENRLRAICNFCSADYLISGTGNMRNHLKSKHSENLPESMLMDQKMQQTTLDKNLMVTKPFKVCKIYFHFLRFV